MPYLYHTRYRALFLPIALCAFATLAHAQTQPKPPAQIPKVFAYAAGSYYAKGNRTYSLRLYRVEAGGQFTSLAPGVISYTDSVDALTADGLGRYLYVCTRADGVRQYRINPNGSLSPLSPAMVAMPSGVDSEFTSAIVAHPSGSSVYLADFRLHNIQRFAIGPDGALTPAQLPLALGGLGKTPYKLVVHPNGQTLYALMGDTNGGVQNQTSYVGQFHIEGDGSLTPLSPLTVDATPDATAIAINAARQAVYVVNSHNDPQTITQFHIGANGALSPMAVPIVRAGFNPNAGIGGASYLAITPDGSRAYAANGAEGSLIGYTVAANGALTDPAPKFYGLGISGMALLPGVNGALYVSGRAIRRVTLNAQNKLDAETAPGLPVPSAPLSPNSTAPEMGSKELIFVRVAQQVVTPVEN